MNHARRLELSPHMVIGGDEEDDIQEAPTVLAQDLAALGIDLSPPRWQQPEGVADADTAPTGAKALKPPRDPSRTFPAPDELEAVADPGTLDRVAAPPVSAAAEAASSDTQESLRPDPLLIVGGVGLGLVLAGGACLAAVAWWVLT